MSKIIIYATGICIGVVIGLSICLSLQYSFKLFSLN